MRYYWLTLTATLLAMGGLFAQSPTTGAAPPLDPAHSPLDAVLVRWEAAIRGVNTLAAQMTRTTLEKAFQQSEVYEGYAKYMKPNLALMYLAKKNKPAIYEKYICTGPFLYCYAP